MIGISTACLYPLETEKAFEYLAKNEIKNTEIFFNTDSELTPSFVSELKHIALANGVRVYSVHPFMSTSDYYYLFCEYPADRRTRLTSTAAFLKLRHCSVRKSLIFTVRAESRLLLPKSIAKCIHNTIVKREKRACTSVRKTSAAATAAVPSLFGICPKNAETMFVLHLI